MIGFWTDEKIARLKELYDAGDSASQIASQLRGNVSRNAVIGKIHRLGLQLRGRERPSTAPAPPAPKQTTAPVGSLAFKVIRSIKAAKHQTDAPNVPLRVVHDAADATPLYLTMDELTSETCRWPYDATPEQRAVDGLSFRYCGCRKISDGPYCFAHHRMAAGGFSASAAPFGSDEHRRRMSEAQKKRHALLRGAA